MGHDSFTPPAQQPRAGAPRAAGQGGGRRVLVVEDEPGIAEALRYILQRDDWLVSILDRGDLVVEAMVAQPPDLVILDINLPGLSGLEVLRILRGTKGLEALPVLLLTARGQDAARQLALDYGASEFMGKPFANKALVETVRRLATV
ncbi:response regulator transcription factor [Pararhodobacter oceanensis]|uniref:Two-component system response regulator n=1 Tax=Pararhodobacter oceanensis TaxID=2172121 RepID=A0A2T8HT30_9RHOB|nr:response regulator [Pararhodobacter oceanensis]PVH28604.1 two-component system response regulator [Pararhodobacter oceanensis]